MPTLTGNPPPFGPPPLQLRDGRSIYDRGPRWDCPTVDQRDSDEDSRFGKLDRNVLLRIAGLIRPRAMQYGLILFVMFFFGMIEQFDKTWIGLSVSALTPKVPGEDVATHNFPPAFVQSWVGQFPVLGQVGLWCSLWAMSYAAGILAHRWLILYQAKVGEKIILDLRQHVFRHLQTMSMSYYDKTKLGRVITLGSSDVDALRDIVINGAGFVVVNATFMATAAFQILINDWRLFLAVFWLAPVLAVLNSYYRRRVGKEWQYVRYGYTAVATSIAENISGVRITTAFDRQEHNLDRFNNLQDNNSSNNIKAARINGTYQPMLFLIRVTGQLVILLYGGYQVCRWLQGDPRAMEPGVVVTVMLCWDAYMTPAIAFGGWYNQLMMSMASGERVFQLVDTKPHIVDAPNAYDLPPVQGNVKFENVTFGYDPNRPVLHDISFEVPAGTSLALVGHTGSGKTSIVSLITRFYQIQQGKILIDGHSIYDITSDSLVKQIGLVLQMNFLFTGTVMDNIRYGRPDATDDDVMRAAKDLDLYDYLVGLEKGFLTDVGERGSALSLGQRQMVCFCRALLADPRLLMLDEATSAVDIATEVRLQRAMDRLIRGRTTIIIAHRLSTIVNADQILVLSHGHIVERGRHHELVQHNGHYAELYRQFSAGLKIDL